MRSFQAFGRALLFVALLVFTGTTQVQAAGDASFLQAAFKSSSPQPDSGVSAMTTTRNMADRADLFHENSIDAGRMTAYGYDFYENTSASDARKKLRLRGGVSGLSTKAAAGVQMIVNW